jgi:hypothetical protein
VVGILHVGVLTTGDTVRSCGAGNAVGVLRREEFTILRIGRDCFSFALRLARVYLIRRGVTLVVLRIAFLVVTVGVRNNLLLYKTSRHLEPGIFMASKNNFKPGYRYSRNSPGDLMSAPTGEGLPAGVGDACAILAAFSKTRQLPADPRQI